MALLQTAETCVVAHTLLNSAVSYLRRRFRAQLDLCLSVGALGSYDRGDMCRMSDVDCYVVFDLAEFAKHDAPMSAAAAAETVSSLVVHIQNAHRNEPLAHRFSIYWSSLEALKQGSYDFGRWPPYDRLAFLCGGTHLAGRTIGKDAIPRVSIREIVANGAEFLLKVARPKLTTAGLLAESGLVGSTALRCTDPVVLTKAVIMPIRLLYVLRITGGEEVIVGTEEAVEHCAGHYSDQDWWPLVEAAREWRRCPPIDPPSWDRGLELLNAHLRSLYVFCLGEYARAVQSYALAPLADELVRWQHDLVTEVAASTSARAYSPKRL